MSVAVVIPGVTADVHALQEWYRETVCRHPRTNQGEKYGGWSVLSGNGEVSDGWTDASSAVTVTDGGPVKDKALETAFWTLHPFKYTRPTAICVGPAAKLLDDIRAAGHGHLYRVRCCWVLGNSSTSWHVDSAEETWRIHVPVVTSPSAVLQWWVNGEKVSVHMPADGRVWMVRVDVSHRAANGDDAERIHIVAQTTSRP